MTPDIKGAFGYSVIQGAYLSKKEKEDFFEKLEIAKNPHKRNDKGSTSETSQGTRKRSENERSLDMAIHLNEIAEEPALPVIARVGIEGVRIIVHLI